MDQKEKIKLLKEQIGIESNFNIVIKSNDNTNEYVIEVNVEECLINGKRNCLNY